MHADLQARIPTAQTQLAAECLGTPPHISHAASLAGRRSPRAQATAVVREADEHVVALDAKRTFSADGFGSTARVEHVSDVFLGASGSIERIEFSSSGSTAGPSESSSASDSFVARFVVTEPVPYSLTASADLVDTNGVAFAQLVGGAGGGVISECAAASAGLECPGSPSLVSRTGTLMPGEYEIRAEMAFDHGPQLQGQGTASITLTFGN